MIGAADQAQENPFPFLAKHLKAAGEASLLTVIETSGSVPQKTNACAIVGKGGELLWGTIGGGRLENDAIKAAAGALESKSPFLFEIDLAEDYSRDAGPICGGRMKIFGAPLDQLHLAAINDLATRADGFARLVICGDDFGKIEWSASTVDDDSSFHLPISPPPRMIVVGAGHCGTAIAQLAHWLGFETLLVDEREELLAEAPIPGGVERFHCRMLRFNEVVSIDSNTYIALVSMGHRSDAEALEACLDSDATYIGMIGSRRKIQLLKRHFMDEKKATAAQWEKIYSPIGLDIGAKAVREIATSVMAQITAVRRKVDYGLR